MGSACSSPMAWEHPSKPLQHEGGHSGGQSQAAAAFDAAMAVNYASMSSSSSEHSSGSWQTPARDAAAPYRPHSRSSQRGLRAEVAALQQQLHLAAAMQVHAYVITVYVPSVLHIARRCHVFCMACMQSAAW